MSGIRRIEIGAVLALAVGILAVALAGSLTGAQLPAAVSAALSAAGDVLGWLRLAVVAALIYGVARAREDA